MFYLSLFHFFWIFLLISWFLELYIYFYLKTCEIIMIFSENQVLSELNIKMFCKIYLFVYNMSIFIIFRKVKMNDLIINEEGIKNKIHTVRWIQVMMDRDLAVLYNVETRTLKQAVKRNIERFPEDFMFQLNNNEIDLMVSQNVIPSKQHLWWSFPFAFTQEWVYMLSSILKSKIAIDISIVIFRAFVKMKKVLLQNASLFQRIDSIEYKLLEHNKNFDKIFKEIESNNIKPIQGIFYDWQIYDAYVFVNDLLKNTKKEIILIDNYIDDTVLTLFSKYPKLKFKIITKNISKQLKLDIEKYNSQYKNLEVKNSDKFHDRFLIIDKKDSYNIWASLKDLWKKIFWFNKIDIELLKWYF